MSVLRPFPLAVLVRRAAAELPRGSVFDLPARRIYRGFEGRDLSVRFHGSRASTPIGPAAGPHTQLAQNVALSFLAGGRILELKTVQENDRPEVPRPCIDMRTVGFNVEWSQELPLTVSLREYAKARLLVAILADLLGLPQAERDVLFDASAGYDLSGLRSEKMRRFFEGVQDASALLDEERGLLRRDLPPALAALADVPCPARLAESVTLSTFHGCPPDEIGAMARDLLGAGFHTIVKLNPTALGYDAVEEILHGRLGHPDLALRPSDFERDLDFAGACALARDLSAEAARRGLGFGLKLTNTLVVENRTGFLPGDVAYLSGEPLHVLALALATKFRDALGADFPLSFSAGIDPSNVATAVASGFVPVTTCTDLLRPGGYRNLHRQAEALAEAMGAAGAATLDAFVRARAGGAIGDAASASDANLRRVAAEALDDERYRAPRTGVPPRKVGSHLHLFDCLACDKCIPVCPNDANFAYETRTRKVAWRDLVVRGGRLVAAKETVLAAPHGRARRHQLANWADACNDCGNCDVFCPEDGGPYVEKPRLFGSLAAYEEDAPRPGFFLRRDGGALSARGRWGGHEVDLVVRPDGSALFSDGVAALRFASADALGPEDARLLVSPAPEGHVVPVGHYHELRALAAGLFAPGAVSWQTALHPDPKTGEMSS